MNTNNIKTVQNIYEAFGRGDVEFIVNSAADNISWNDAGYPDLPFGSRNRKKAEIAEFFQTLSQNMNYTKFEPREFIANDNIVIVLGYHEGKVLSTGKVLGQDWVMVWKFDDKGKVTYYRSFLDSNELVTAFKK